MEDDIMGEMGEERETKGGKQPSSGIHLSQSLGEMEQSECRVEK